VVAGAVSAKVAAGPPTTTVAVPVMEEVTVSVAVMVWLPGVARVALKVPDPVNSVESAANVAAESELVKWTVPA